MKKNIKLIITMLCIGLSPHLNADIEVANKTIEKAFKQYNPETIQNPFSLAGAATMWAIGLIDQLTTTERVALAYHALNNENNPNAEDQSVAPIQRIIKQFIDTELSQISKDYVEELAKRNNIDLPAKWYPAYGLPGLKQLFSYFKAQPKTTFTQDYRSAIFWPRVDRYAQSYYNTDKSTQELLNSYIKGIVTAASQDMKRKDFGNNIGLYFGTINLTTIPWTDVENNLLEKIQGILYSDFASKGIAVPTNLKALITSAINNANLKTTFDQITKPQAPKKISIREAVQINEDANLVINIQQAIQKLTQNKITKSSELKEISQLEGIEAIQRLVAKDFNKPNLMQALKNYDTNFIAQEKPLPSTDREELKTLLTKMNDELTKLKEEKEKEEKEKLKKPTQQLQRTQQPQRTSGGVKQTTSQQQPQASPQPQRRVLRISR